MKIKVDAMTRPRVFSLGIDIGSNGRIGDQSSNFFVEVSLAFWTFGLEFDWSEALIKKRLMA